MKIEALATLAQELGKCQACHLRQDALAPVGWYGNPNSPLVIVGEGPGGQEDDYGCPLIGPSGQLLDKALWATKMTRDRILTTNIIKCRPKGNRTPSVEEGAFCAKIWLEKELAIIQPKVIVALGSVAMHYLIDPTLKITKQRGLWFKTEDGFDCIATYHPSYLLRLSGHDQVAAKWDVFHDLEAARAKAAAACPNYNFQSDNPIDLFALFAKRQKIN
ncbi:MAG: uracil-DNA glycosylase [Acidaminococcaceae bacterium]|nr:uracil-DNA glycosylase [Acidaminococcaceae bacterium]